MTVIIPTLDPNSDRVNACLNALERHTDPSVAVIIADGPNTFAQNCNAGADHSRSDVIVFLNDDTEVTEGWHQNLLAHFDDDSTAVTGARLVYADGRIQHAGIYFTSPPLTAHNLQGEAPSRNVDAVTGACMAIRHAVFNDLGGFDEDYQNGYEDVDLCLRVRALGHQIWYENTATVIHHESQSGPARWAHVQDNIALLIERWEHQWTNLTA